jgi:hypothetical protein
MSKQTVHNLVVRYNQLPEGSSEKAKLKVIIGKEIRHFNSEHLTLKVI